MRYVPDLTDDLTSQARVAKLGADKVVLGVGGGFLAERLKSLGWLAAWNAPAEGSSARGGASRDQITGFPGIRARPKVVLAATNPSVSLARSQRRERRT